MNGTKLVAGTIPCAMIAAFAFLKFELPGSYYQFLIREDGIVEYATALAYAIGCVVAVSCSRGFFRGRNRLGGCLYVLLALGFFFIAMEEISWGQRIFNFRTPASLETVNLQHEANLHNILSAHALHFSYIIVGFYSSFIRYFPFWKKRSFTRTLIRHTAPAKCLASYFLPVFLFYAYCELIVPLEVSILGKNVIWRRIVHPNDQEPLEMILSFGFLLFVLMVQNRQVARTKPEAVVGSHMQSCSAVRDEFGYRGEPLSE